MTRKEVTSLLNKIKNLYQNFSITESVEDEWFERLEPYDNADVIRKLEEHLRGDYADRLPMIHFLTKYLKTNEEKKKITEDMTIYCNLCGKSMLLSEYNQRHQRRCLRIRALQKAIGKAKNETITYEELDEHTDEILERLSEKYIPIKKELTI